MVGVKRPLSAGRVDSRGRQVKVAAGTTEGRSTAPLPSTILPVVVQQIVDGLLGAAADTWIADMGTAVDDDPDNVGYITIAVLAAPDKAGNNCFGATFEMQKAVIEQVGLGPGETVDAAEIVFDNGVHWAPVITTSDGERWVVDFTFRQFDDSSEWPYVAALGDWERTVIAASGAMHDSVHHESLFHRHGDFPLADGEPFNR